MKINCDAFKTFSRIDIFKKLLWQRKFTTLGQAPGFTHRHWTKLERLSRDQHYSM